jgi:hypothetical protein
VKGTLLGFTKSLMIGIGAAAASARRREDKVAQYDDSGPFSAPAASYAAGDAVDGEEGRRARRFWRLSGVSISARAERAVLLYEPTAPTNKRSP